MANLFWKFIVKANFVSKIQTQPEIGSLEFSFEIVGLFGPFLIWISNGFNLQCPMFTILPSHCQIRREICQKEEKQARKSSEDMQVAGYARFEKVWTG